MSRTDVHRPWLVQQADPHNRHLFYRFQSWSTGEPELMPWKNLTCGCRLCTSYDWRKAERRRARHGARREILAQINDNA